MLISIIFIAIMLCLFIIPQKARAEDKGEALSYSDASSLSQGDVFAITGGRREGFDEDQAQESREAYGDNVILTQQKKSYLRRFAEAYLTPFTLVLIVLAGISLYTGYIIAPEAEKDLLGPIIIMVMVIASGTMTLVQSVRSDSAAEALQELVEVTTAVKRDGVFQEIPVDDVVIGDLIQLSAGDMIPADLRLIQTKDLFIDQAALTGESYPVEKMADWEFDDSLMDTEYGNLVFMGSNVVSGSAIGIVVANGKNTIFGRVAEDATQSPVKTSFDLGIDSTSSLLIRFMLVMAPTVILINGLTKGDWMEALLFGISVAVGLTPEMLPMVVTSNLVKGANSMAKGGTIIKNLSSIQNFGAIDVLCTDKTGTLTQDQITLRYYLNLKGENDLRVLRHAYLNSFYQTGLKNVMDLAVIEGAEEELDLSILNYEKVDEIPFDFARRRMSVAVEDETGKTQMITKGAIEEMLSICDYVDYHAEVFPLDEEKRRLILDDVNELNADGFRVLGVAQKTNPPVAGEFSVKDESEMVLIGYLAFLDPPKDSAKKAILALQEHGVDVKVVTGDNEFVTMNVAEQVGLESQGFITGEEVEAMNQAQLSRAVEDYDIFVKINPQQKARLVDALRENGDVVGFLGDGINDSPALRAADVGVTVDTAVDIAKESADIILLEKDLMILERGLLEGRTTFGNIMKYIKATTSSNFGNMFSVLVASTFLPFLPMLPIQILFLNLIYDLSCMSIPWDHMDPEFLMEPKEWEAKGISRFMIWFGPTSSIFDITTYAIMFFVICPAIAGGPFAELTGASKALFISVFHAGWFIVSLWTQTLVLYALRTPKFPFLQSSPSFVMASVTMLGIIIGTIVPFTRLGTQLGLGPLNGAYWIMLIVTVAAYLSLVTVVKNIYIRRFGELI